MWIFVNFFSKEYSLFSASTRLYGSTMLSFFHKSPASNLFSFMTVALCNMCKALFCFGERMSGLNLGRVPYVSICQSFSEFSEMLS